MTIWAFVMVIALLGIFLLCIIDCTETERERRRNPDASCCRGFLMVILFGVILWANGSSSAPVERDPMQIFITGFMPMRRQPYFGLPAADYLMAKELAKSGQCTYFNMRRDADIDRFKRCSYFFPELRSEFAANYEERVGFCLA